jgi:hypothetical protein
MSAHSFLGYNCIMRIVNPVNRYGFAVILHNNLDDELKRGLNRLLSVICVPIILFIIQNQLHSS